MHSSDERTMSALAHASALLNLLGGGVVGILAALIIWLLQKEKSAWAAFQALQAVVFQSAVSITVIVIVGGVWVAGFAVSFLTIGFGTLIAVPVMIAVFFAGMLTLFGTTLYGIYAAVQVYNSKEFSYPVIGEWLKKHNQG